MTLKDIKDAKVIARKYTRTIQDAEDVVQKACVKALVKSGQCTGDSSAWFRSIVRTTALNHHRSDKPTCQYEARYHDHEIVTDKKPLYDLEKNIMGLPKDLAQVLHCLYIEGKKQKEAATQLEITQPTLRKRRDTAIQILKKELKF